MKILKCKRGGVSTVVAFLIAFLLIGTITVSFMFVVENQGQSASTGVEIQKQALKGVREQLQATLQETANGQLSIETLNTGSVTAEIIQLLVTKSDNSLDTLNINPSEILMPLEGKIITTAYAGEYLRLGLLTQRGNVFPVQSQNTPQPNPSPNPTPDPNPTPTPPSPEPLPTPEPEPEPEPTPPPTPPPTPTPQPFDFTLSTSPDSGTVQQGTSTTTIITTTLLSGSAGQVTLSTSGLPNGASATLTLTDGFPTFTSTLTITTSTTTSPGTHTITISGTDGELTRTATYTLTVTEQPFDFTVSVTPNSGSMIADSGSITATATISVVSGNPQLVSLSMNTEGAPASLSTTSGTPNPYFTSTLSVSNAPEGTYTITVYGSSGELTRSATYILTVTAQPTTTVHFYISGVGSSGDPLTVDGVSYSVTNFPLSFTWVVGSQHAYAWTNFLTDESSYVSGSDTGYAWGYSTCTNGLPTTLSGTVTAPESEGSITGYYTSYVYVSVESSTGGSVTPSSGWHLPGTSFTATANTGYGFDNWEIYGGTRTSNPITVSIPVTLKAVFSLLPVSLTVSTRDYQGYAISGASIYVYTQQQTLYASGSTASNGKITFQVQPGSYYLAVMQNTNAFGYTTSLYGWSDGDTNPVRSISISTPTTYTATYKTPLTFQNLEAGIGTNLFSVGYWASGTVTSVHNTQMTGVGVHVTWNPDGVLERSTDTTTGSDGSFNAQRYVGGIVSDVYNVDFSMTSVPNGYQPLSLYRFYP